MLVDPEGFGLDRDELGRALEAEGIPTRPYFHPPGHRLSAYADLPKVHLPNTDLVSRRALCLPLASHMDPAEAVGVARAIRRIQAHAGALRVAT